MSSASNPNLNPNPNLDPSAAWGPNDAPPTQHHLHKSSDVLPGAARAQVGRGAGNDDDDDVRDPESFEDRLAAPDQQVQDQYPSSAYGAEGRNAWTEERPLGVQPTARGGVAIGGREDLPETHASAADKLVGKTQKVVGKITKNPEMHERGELRESGGKAAAMGEGRAPHD
uniref:Polyketide synthetase protein n=1 Tax=Ganoderma boninense TaxID=34458 RepID=A0A5K1K4G5_9APHY|nr:Polyketide synthetase protein [Ganoderma boninense]